MRTCALAIAVTCAVSAVVGAQDFHGVVRDSSKFGLNNVELTLVDSSSRVAGLVHTNLKGEFSLRVPESGRYAFSARKIGYSPWYSPWMIIEDSELVAIEIQLKRIPPELEAVIVRAQRDTAMRERLFGFNLNAMGGRFITQNQIEAHSSEGRLDDVLRWTAPPGFSIDGAGCLAAVRRPGVCLLVLLDGISPIRLDDVPATWIDHIVVVGGIEAQTIWGPMARSGVVILITKDYMFRKNKEKNARP